VNAVHTVNTVATGVPGWLARHGVRRVHGHPFPGSVGPVLDRANAALLAEADGTVGSGIGATWDGAVLTLLSRQVEVSERGLAQAGSVAEFDAIVAEVAASGGGSVAVRIDFDPDVHTDPGPAARVDPSLAPRLRAREVAEGQRLDIEVLLAGAGVVRAGMVGELARLAESTGLGVLNTFTAKGMFAWDSPYHLGTAFLQEQDLALAGIGPDTRVLLIGVDTDECPTVLLDAAGVQIGLDSPVWSVPAAMLPDLAGRVGSAHGLPPEPGALYRVLAGIVQPMYQSDALPFLPPRAAVELLRSLPADGVITVEPGIAGMWVARAIPTTRLGSVRVPAAGGPGGAAAAALNLALAGVPALAIVEAPLSVPSQQLMDLARSRGLPLVVAEWGETGDHRTAGDYSDAIAAALASGGVHLIRVPVDLSVTTLLTDAAGPLVAWSKPVNQDRSQFGQPDE
jgi:hypothetical protein